jgi:hypothetical protein
MKKIIILFLFVILCIGCEESSTGIYLEDGNYSGTFMIIESNGQTQTGNINFNFSNNNYSVVPEYKYLPPAGAGTFSRNSNTINLVDTAIHTAEFDWSLILNGNFNLAQNGKALILEQNDTKQNRKRIISLTKQN